MKYIRDTYNVPAKRGAIIYFKKRRCRIMSACAGKLRIWDFSEGHKYYIHPTWEVRY